MFKIRYSTMDSALLSPVTSLHILVSLAAGALSLAVYRVYFHPLARYPGPKYAAATYWYATYYEVWLDGEFVDHIQFLHEKYGTPKTMCTCLAQTTEDFEGPVVRIGPTDVISFLSYCVTLSVTTLV